MNPGAVDPLSEVQCYRWVSEGATSAWKRSNRCMRNATPRDRTHQISNVIQRNQFFSNFRANKSKIFSLADRRGRKRPNDTRAKKANPFRSGGTDPAPGPKSGPTLFWARSAVNNRNLCPFRSPTTFRTPLFTLESETPPS